MKHILMLEDDPAVASLLQRVLEDEKYYVSATDRVAYAREFLQQVDVDLLVADVLLSDGTAFSAVEIAKQRNVPFFLITGSISHMAELKANGQFHLSKPFKLADFLSAVRDRIGPGDGVGRN
jgi:DNA-binding NtrC family response regulator